jgi:hypothetical protein
MLFADAEGFWRAPSVYDVIGIAGFLIGIVSIWLAWWLARRDIQRRLTDAANQASKAARDEVRRVAQALIQTGLSVTIRSLELAREACHGKRWPRATELCILAREQLARVLAQPAADETLQSELRSSDKTLWLAQDELVLPLETRRHAP